MMTVSNRKIGNNYNMWIESNRKIESSCSTKIGNNYNKMTVSNMQTENNTMTGNIRSTRIENKQVEEHRR